MKEDLHYNKIFWFIVGMCLFGAGLSIYAVQLDPRHIDIVLTFWLSTCVAAGVGYLIGNSVKGKPSENAVVNQADNVNVTNNE